MRTDPTLQEQESWWNAWNLKARADLDEFCSEVARYVLDFLARSGPPPRSVLEVGCGTGWLSDAMQRAHPPALVVGFDLAGEALALARSRYPRCSFRAGDFLGSELRDIAAAGPAGGFDVVTSVDAIGHVADHASFVRRCGALLAPGGRLVLVTQNPFVWRRTSWLAEQGSGQLRNWPTLAALRRLLGQSGFALERVRTLLPQGDRGVLRARRYLQFALRRLLGPARARAVQERMRLGRALIVEARLR
jgi:2-polyprenyl-3-methyl-5-hydroxy-6-metoxy-1,4-benzoquinol methylase